MIGDAGAGHAARFTNTRSAGIKVPGDGRADNATCFTNTRSADITMNDEIRANHATCLANTRSAENALLGDMVGMVMPDNNAGFPYWYII